MIITLTYQMFTILVFVLSCGISVASMHRPILLSSASRPAWGSLPPVPRTRDMASNFQAVQAVPRGGSAEEEEEYDSEESEYEDESDDDASVKTAAPQAVEASDEEEAAEVQVSVTEYDEPLMAPPMANLLASLGVMLLGRKVDLFSPTMVRIARFAFILYLATLQAFLLYVRIQAKARNDRTSVSVTNPLSSVLQSQLGAAGGSSGMVKNLASSFLSQTSTVMEYDLKQARNMQSGLIFNMAFMWFLHFKMEQVQPVLIQSMTGFVNLVFSPLFQVYVLGRNLERPFKNPAARKLPEESAEPEGEATEPEGEATEPEGEESEKPKIAGTSDEGTTVTKVEESDSDEEEEGDDAIESKGATNAGASGEAESEEHDSEATVEEKAVESDKAEVEKAQAELGSDDGEDAVVETEAREVADDASDES